RAAVGDEAEHDGVRLEAFVRVHAPVRPVEADAGPRDAEIGGGGVADGAGGRAFRPFDLPVVPNQAIGGAALESTNGLEVALPGIVAGDVAGDAREEGVELGGLRRRKPTVRRCLSRGELPAPDSVG